MRIPKTVGAWMMLFAISLCRSTLGQFHTSPKRLTAPTTHEVANRVGKSLVMISTEDKEGNPIAQGSGFFIAPHLVVTNLHVIKRAHEGVVKPVGDDTTYKITDVIAFNLRHDVCVLYVADAKGTPLPTSRDEAEVGEDIVVAGNPEGLEGTFSKGIVSAIRDDTGLIQIDAPISPGSSGGPVVNEHGEVIGITVSSFTEGQNLNFAVPIRYIERSAEEKIPVDIAGRLAVTDRENLGFHGAVRRSRETQASYSYNEATGDYVLGPALAYEKLSFFSDGRLQDTESFWNGKCGEQTLYDYRYDGIQIEQTLVAGCKGKGEELDLSLTDAINTMASRVHLCESEERGSPGVKYHSISKYDCKGREIEYSRPESNYESVMKYNAEGWEIENLEYEDGKLTTDTRSTYETNAYGDWVTRHETQWSANSPSLGFVPLLNQYREIQYYGGG